MNQKHMIQLLKNTTDSITYDLTTVGIHHEQQHQELLLTDIKIAFYANPILPKYDSETDLTAVKNEGRWA